MTGGFSGAIRATNIGAASTTASRTSRICSRPQIAAACAVRIAADHQRALRRRQAVVGRERTRDGVRRQTSQPV